jgi:hypothetical protein
MKKLPTIPVLLSMPYAEAMDVLDRHANNVQSNYTHRMELIRAARAAVQGNRPPAKPNGARIAAECNRLEQAGLDFLTIRPEAIPEGRALVHNHVIPTRVGFKGFRVWFTDLPVWPGLTECDCGWLKELGPHYRTRTTPPQAPEYIPTLRT